MNLKDLEQFIVDAKKACYVGDGRAIEPSRVSSQDLEYKNGLWSYRDSYFGGTDFIGQEIVWYNKKPIWAMNYYGRIVRDDLFDAETGAMIIKKSLSAMYGEGRFLGGFEYEVNEFLYIDESNGDYKNFVGHETIMKGDTRVYELDYHGGLIRN